MLMPVLLVVLLEALLLVVLMMLMLVLLVVLLVLQVVELVVVRIVELIMLVAVVVVVAVAMYIYLSKIDTCNENHFSPAHWGRMKMKHHWTGVQILGKSWWGIKYKTTKQTGWSEENVSITNSETFL